MFIVFFSNEMVVAVAVVVVVVVVVVDLWKNICTDQTLILNSKSHNFFYI